ncbi:head GIN domain-containing protein [Flavobacterium saccharophilum]|uniref:Putative auto-transporter adhesin, head GIN domain n=1 Tax=Flavobacterium saccharophilum TaxID=29534 RepID=A0A1M7CHG6_9FLAO|nr:head GIN domain-containing protein [Flavobacterium saccharophilum]SHL66613.1 Putative auto-transporter adhesin, head GIN domain [Flavobacterium saccharophilum]
MKKLIQLVVCGAFLVCFVANAQSSSNKVDGNGKVVTQTRNTADYDAIKVSGSFDVDLVAGKEGKITIKGEENILNVIVVEVEENTLKIQVKKNTNIRSSMGKKVQVTVPFEKISELSLSGSGDIQSKDAIKNDKFLARLSGSGNFNLAIDSNTLELNLSGSGNVHLKGSADSFTTKLSGSGDIDAAELKSKKVDVNVSGSGDSKVNCSESLTARVSGSGDIKYTGNPEKRDVKVSGSGNISKA